MSPSLAVADDRQPLRVAARLCAIAAAILTFAISAMTLHALGAPYEAASGSALQKLHPATYLAVMAMILEVASAPRPFAYLAALPLRFPGGALFVLNLASIVAYAALFQKAPVTPLIDTFLVGAILLALHEDFSPRERAAVRLALHVVMFVNAGLGIAEFAFDFRLTPFVAGGQTILGDYRSTALLGHPLLNAGTTALYAAMLTLGGDRALKLPLRVIMTTIQLVALVPFGGRTSLTLAVVFVCLAALKPIGEAVGGRRFDLRTAIVAAIAAPLAACAAAAAWSGGSLAPLIERFSADRGSAQTRVIAFDLFDAFALRDILMGPDPKRLAALQNALGIEYGIENSWLGLIFQYGAVMTMFFLIGFAALLWEFWRRAKSGAWAITLLFLVQVSASASLSVKTLAFNQFAILMLAMFDRSDGDQAATRGAA